MSETPADSDLPYDPDARRDTPLALKLKQRIRRDGPITVAEYMRACLTDPEHGYYVRQQAIGANGDFVTAPEISQVFGELIGLWSVVVWQQMGSPFRFNLVELGPGRGTMMADALRAARIVPGFIEAAQLHLIEANATLIEIQRSTLYTYATRAHWHPEIATALGPGCTIPEAPTIILGNEFLDTQPIAQFIFQGGQWRERAVGLDTEGQLSFTILANPDNVFKPTLGPGYILNEGDIHERNGGLAFFAVTVLQSLETCAPYAGLLIDYGHSRSAVGDTLQAVEQHRHVSPLYAPGETDLTAHVDFETFASLMHSTRKSKIDGPTTQAEFLGSLGIMERASRLMSANPQLAHEIELGVARLMAVPGMGNRFKAIGVRSANLPPLPGFPPPQQTAP